MDEEPEEAPPLFDGAGLDASNLPVCWVCEITCVGVNFGLAGAEVDFV